MKNVATYLCLLLSFGCSTYSQIPPLPNSDSGVPDASQIECDSVTLGRTMEHCLDCDTSCPIEDSNRCIAGRCLCGIFEACSPGSDCVHDHCVPTNPTGRVCEFTSECRNMEACVEGRCSPYFCSPEICDGIDNDCDGFIDNIGLDPLSRECINDTTALREGDVVHEPCRGGIQLCHSGTWTQCIGSITPVEETGLLMCDLVDNNCDGCIDGIMSEEGVCEEPPADLYDVLFLIDTSGSMVAEPIQNVRNSIRVFSSRLSASENIRWGIVHIPSLHTDGLVELYQDLTNYSSFRARISDWEVGLNGTEPQWDAVHLSLSGELGVSWRPGATKVLILFTDEPGTPPRHSSIVRSQEEMCELVISSGAVLISVVSEPDDFSACAHQVLDLPLTWVGSLRSCGAGSDCPPSELCEDSVCLSSSLIEFSNQIELNIDNPCETL